MASMHWDDFWPTPNLEEDLHIMQIPHYSHAFMWAP